MEVLQRTANRGSVSTGPYEINNSLKLETDNTEYLMAEGRPQGNQQTWTYSCWLKRTEVDNGVVAQYIFSAGSDGKLGIYFRDDASYPDDRIFIYLDEGNSQKWIGQVNQSFRDTAAWYHFVFTCDSTDSTPADRTKLYINGVQQTITFNDTLNANVLTRVGDNGNKFAIGYRVGTGYGYNGYIAECVLVDGSALAPTSFGEYDADSGIWKPKDVSSLSLGTTGFYMKFDDSSNLGKVQTGTSQGNFDKYNITAADQATDTPTNNFATTNPLYKYGSETFTTEGATVVTKNANGWVSPQSTICPASGKWYMEFKFNALDSRVVGAAPIGGTLWDSAQHYGGTVGSNSVGYADTGYLYVNDSGVSSNYGPSYDNSNIIAVALDMDNGYIYWAKDNTWINSANPAGGSGGYALPAGLVEHSIGASIYQQAKQSFANYGGYTTISISSAATDANGYGSFEYAPPSGYYALCTKNLAEYG